MASSFDKECFNSILKWITEPDILEFANKCIDIIPQYFYHIGASSSGKYHPAYALGDGGLLRHTIGLCRFMRYMFEVESVGGEFTERQKQLMYVAGIMHDSFKRGIPDVNGIPGKHTEFSHPLIAADAIEDIRGIIPPEELEFVQDCIRTHMGQFNINAKLGIELSKPETKAQVIVHLADYLASRNDVKLDFDSSMLPDFGD